MRLAALREHKRSAAVIYARNGCHNLAPSREKLLLTALCADTIYDVIKDNVSMLVISLVVLSAVPFYGSRRETIKFASVLFNSGELSNL